MASPWEVYELSTIAINTGDSITFQEGFYKVMDVKGILTGTVGAAPDLDLTVGAVSICSNATNWTNLSTLADLALGNTAGMVIVPGVISSPVIAKGQVLSLTSNNVSATVFVTIAKVKGLA